MLCTSKVYSIILIPSNFCILKQLIQYLWICQMEGSAYETIFLIVTHMSWGDHSYHGAAIGWLKRGLVALNREMAGILW